MKRFLVLFCIGAFLVLPCLTHAQTTKDDSSLDIGSRTARFLQYQDGPNPPSPPPIPTPPPDAQFDYVKIDIRGEGDVDQIEFGTPGKDKIEQYGSTGNVTQYVEGDEDADWILQVGGDLNSNQTAIAGNGDDTIYQYGGKGDTTQYAEGGLGNKTIIQVGGEGANTMEIAGGRGGAHIEQYGGQGTNTMKLTGSTGDDVTMMYGSPANDSMTYTVNAGADTVTINGGSGCDTLTINKNQKNFTIQDYAGKVLLKSGSGGSTITILNIQYTKVIGDGGEILWEYEMDDITSKSITVLPQGSGKGTVVSKKVAGIDCGSTCQGSFREGTTIKLSVKADGDSVFRGWSGACTGTSKTCTLVMSDDYTVTVTFASDPLMKATPSSKKYGSVKLTKTKTATFTIKNMTTNGKKDLLVGSINSDNPAFVLTEDPCSNSTIPPKGACKFKVQFVPVTGPQGATLAIPSNDPGVPVTELSLTAEGVP